MKKFFTSILLIAAFLLPWVANAQSLGDYTYETGIDGSKWVTLDDYTDVSGTANADSWASSVHNIGFAFPFGEEAYSQYSVNSDGNMRLGSTVPVTAVFAADSVAPQVDSVTIILTINDTTMGYTTPAPGTYTFAVGDMVTAQAVANEGYHFEGWNAMGMSIPINPLILPVPAEAAGLTIPVTAVFAPDSVAPQTDSVTFTLAVNDPNMGFTTPAPGVQTIAVGEDITLTAIPFNGYHFVAWEASIMGETERTDENPVEIGFDMPIPAGIDITVTAIFAPDSVGPQTDSVSFTLAVNDPTMGTIDPAPGVHTIAVGDEITLTATPFPGYHFVAWEASVMGETERTDENPVEIGFDDPMPEGIDIVLTAIFAPDSTQGISTASSAQCSVYPNPADDATTISVTGVNGKVSIAVVDMNGRTVASETMECAADCVKTLNVANLAQGAYFVRITGENVNMVKKLVVR